MYVDSHEKPDVVQYRAVFTTKWMALFELMTFYSGDTMSEAVPRTLEDGQSEVYIWVTHDEPIFYANDDGGKGWYDKTHPVLMKNERSGLLWSPISSVHVMVDSISLRMA